MRYAAAVVILLSVNPSLSFAQGHQGSPQEQAACGRPLHFISPPLRYMPWL